MNVELSPAFVLHQRAYRESSVILDVFSEHHGRLSLIARGVRRAKSKQSALLQLYQPLLLSWIPREGLSLLTAVEVDRPRYLLQGQSALCGLYINELMVKLLVAHSAENKIFDAYHQILLALQHGKNIETKLRLFEKCLLTHLGYGLIIDREVDSNKVIEPQLRYTYQADSGLYRSSQQQSWSISGRSLQHLIAERDFDQQSLLEIKQLMRMVIHFYLGGKKLQSRQLFSELQRYAN